MKIGMTGYGSPETTTGGNALKFYASVRLDLRRIQTLKDNPEVATRLEAELREKFQPTEVKPDEVDEDAEV